MSHDLIDLLRRPSRPRILVVGDVILDQYLFGTAQRISPEAPIPLLRVTKQEDRLGGAGSVASMLSALESDVVLATVIGNDRAGKTVRRLLEEQKIDASPSLELDARPTTVKQRILGLAQARHAQQLLRVDQEEDSPLAPAETDALLAAIAPRMAAFDAVLVSDYNKGVCSGDMVPRLVELAQKHGVKVVADPIRGGDYRRYRGCACITPNRLEAGLAVNMTIRSPEEGLIAAEKMLEFGIESCIVTLDRDGMAWVGPQGQRGLFPVRERQVYDITGAGDMVLSVIGFGLAGGLEYPRLIELANLAGGLEVEKLGVVPLTREDLMAEIESRPTLPAQKHMELDELLVQLAKRRAAGQKIVMTNGCFDLMHPGHVASIEEARRFGDCLVVGLNSDRSVRALKGAGRPIIDQAGRAAMLAGLQSVDYVVVFDEASVAPLVARIRPDVLVKAAQYGPDQVVGHEIVESYGGRIVLAPMQGSYSTSDLIQRIRELDDR